jgi:hypothetical protein
MNAAGRVDLLGGIRSKGLCSPTVALIGLWQRVGTEDQYRDFGYPNEEQKEIFRLPSVLVAEIHRVQGSTREPAGQNWKRMPS